MFYLYMRTEPLLRDDLALIFGFFCRPM
jgi:hypothetical protein